MKFLYAILLLLCIDQKAWATSDIWTRAEVVSGVPKHKIYSIAVQESGIQGSDGKLRPWPWTINSEKGSMRFKSKKEAYLAIKGLVKEGVTNIDIGLMQINLRWHWETIKDRDILDPTVNVLTAAEILAGLMKRNGGDVKVAIAHYHNVDKEIGIPYESRVSEISALAEHAFR